LKPVEVTPESCVLNWDTPEDNGGCDIRNYIVERRDANRQSYNKIGTTKELKFTDTKLVEGRGYVYRVSAENEVGVGEPAESKTVTAKYGFSKYS
jgi:titin